jgi:hypothetical protein
MNKFAKKFFKVLEEQDSVDADRAAMEASLDKGTQASEFDTNLEPSTGNDDLAAQAAKIKSAQSQAMSEELSGWVAKCDEFLAFLNGTEGQSIQTRLANAEPDTIFDRMKQSEQRKIARVATELASLTESFRGYVAQTENPAFKYV